MIPLKRINPTGNNSEREKEKGERGSYENSFSLLNGPLLLKSKILLCCFLICMKLFTTFLCKHGEIQKGRERFMWKIMKLWRKKRWERYSATYGKRRGVLLKLRSWMWIDSSILTIAPCGLSAVNLAYNWCPWSVFVCVYVCVYSGVCVCVCVKWAASFHHLLPLAAPATIKCVTRKRIPMKSFRSFTNSLSKTRPWCFPLWHKIAVPLFRQLQV